MARGSFLNILGQGLGVFAFLGMGYGILSGQVRLLGEDIQVRHPNVPKAFEGLKNGPAERRALGFVRWNA